MTCSIKNYHYEMREYKEKKIIKADSDAVKLRKEYERKLKELQEKRDKLESEKKQELKERSERGFIGRLLNKQNKDIDEIDAQIELLNKQ